jgi:hypothetical protein
VFNGTKEVRIAFPARLQEVGSAWFWVALLAILFPRKEKGALSGKSVNPCEETEWRFSDVWLTTFH